MTHDRFDYAANVGRAGTYKGYRGRFWPPADASFVTFLDLAGDSPREPDLTNALASLRDAIDDEWRVANDGGAPSRTRFVDPGNVATALQRIGDRLGNDADRTALALRTKAVRDGYDDEILKALADLDEDVVVVAGQISTWFGKRLGGLPTAFACRQDPLLQDTVTAATSTRAEIGSYLATLHADLRLGDVPAFTATRLFFMAGEGERHPKHIAYFLPEDEGVKFSPYKKTYYFANTHRALLGHQSAPLASRFLDVGVTFDPADERFATVPVLGVLGHEFGHCVHRPGATYKSLNAADRWVSVVLQEAAADVFGILVTTEVWAERHGLSQGDVLTYHLAECLRYANRGLGHFPDSDGMLFQLGYLAAVGALTVEERATGPVLRSDPATVLAGVRSLARVLADALLHGEAEPALALHATYGPASTERLAPLLGALRRFPPGSVEYVQEHVRAPAGTAARPGEAR